MNDANGTQVSGGHYKGMSVQPWDMPISHTVDANVHSTYCYLVRLDRKGMPGTDRQKVAHYIMKLCEYRPPAPTRLPGWEGYPDIEEYVEACGRDECADIARHLLRAEYDMARAVMYTWLVTHPRLVDTRKIVPV